MGSPSLMIILILVVWIIVLAPLMIGNNKPIRRSGDGYDETRVLHEGKDWKTQIVELVAQHGLGTVRYDVEGTGPDHERHFTADAVVADEVLGHGEGTSKKAAERAAAAAACETIAARFPSQG